jgi:hypothetical protein
VIRLRDAAGNTGRIADTVRRNGRKYLDHAEHGSKQSEQR